MYNVDGGCLIQGLTAFSEPEVWLLHGSTLSATTGIPLYLWLVFLYQQLKVELSTVYSLMDVATIRQSYWCAGDLLVVLKAHQVQSLPDRQVLPKNDKPRHIKISTSSPNGW